MANPVVGIIMGSRSDWGVMENAAQTLDELGVAYEAKVVSAHRTPDRLYEYARSVRDRGLKAIIAGAGGATASATATVEPTSLSPSPLPGVLTGTTTNTPLEPLQTRMATSGWCSALRDLSMPTLRGVAGVSASLRTENPFLPAQEFAPREE